MLGGCGRCPNFPAGLPHSRPWTGHPQCQATHWVYLKQQHPVWEGQGSSFGILCCPRRRPSRGPSSWDPSGGKGRVRVREWGFKFCLEMLDFLLCGNSQCLGKPENTWGNRESPLPPLPLGFALCLCALLPFLFFNKNGPSSFLCDLPIDWTMSDLWGPCTHPGVGFFLLPTLGPSPEHGGASSWDLGPSSGTCPRTQGQAKLVLLHLCLKQPQQGAQRRWWRLSDRWRDTLNTHLR